MKTLMIINFVCIAIFTLSNIYQIIVILFIKSKKITKVQNHKFAILIAARNEEKVIGNLIKSIHMQKYPKHLVETFVIADNCTDNTANVAKKCGAIVFERFNKNEIGKGYALDYLLKEIKKRYEENEFDAFIVFDADNLIDENFITEINKTYSLGYEVVTSYRNSKNYDDNWISAGSSLLFLHSSRFARHKMLVNSNCAISGTGFLFSNKVLNIYGSWKFHTLAEDAEFMINNKQNNIKTGYCNSAMVYDEQPVSFSQFWKQRIRWTKGNIQVIEKYRKKLLNSKIFRIDKSAPDTITIATILMTINFIAILINIIMMCLHIGEINNYSHIKLMVLLLFISYIMVYFVGLIITITEWNKIRASGLKKILYTFTFPIIIACYVPIPFVSLFSKDIKWEMIKHLNTKTINDMR